LSKKRNVNHLNLKSSSIVQIQPKLNGKSTGSDKEGSKASDYDGLTERLADLDLTERFSDLEIGLEFNLELRAEDLKFLNELGAGNGGTVSKVMHVTTKKIMAKK
ncbi:13017_t:CDS:1, partial [Ambispora leptoticha]